MRFAARQEQRITASHSSSLCRPEVAPYLHCRRSRRKQRSDHKITWNNWTRKWNSRKLNQTFYIFLTIYILTLAQSSIAKQHNPPRSPQLLENKAICFIQAIECSEFSDFIWFYSWQRFIIVTMEYLINRLPIYSRRQQNFANFESAAVSDGGIRIQQRSHTYAAQSYSNDNICGYSSTVLPLIMPQRQRNSQKYPK